MTSSGQFPFDADRLDVTGEARQVLEGVATGGLGGTPYSLAPRWHAGVPPRQWRPSKRWCGSIAGVGRSHWGCRQATTPVFACHLAGGRWPLKILRLGAFWTWRSMTWSERYPLSSPLTKGSLFRSGPSHSIGRCNSVREYSCRRPIPECLAWARVELARNPIQLGLCVAGEVGPLCKY